MDEGEQRLFRFPFKLPSFEGMRTIGVYASGILYALGFWTFMDAVLFSKYNNASDLHVTFVDWIPFLCSTMGMVIVNSIEKNRLLQGALSGENSMFSGGDVDSQMAWQARTVLFLGFALLAGGISGSLVVLIIKFLVREYATFPTVGMGIENVVANACVMLSCVVLWVAQNIEDEYSYNLTL
ncbi:Vacuolar protein sorting-associated protein 68 [Nakaseomyces bracarensis]|uniref:Vacuolar protein sorting-associated protein 68 n=1 Tax=Nakaseomyces bracarensis TaxID=273131 RepID=A0ABR4NT89_9SACH